MRALGCVAVLLGGCTLPLTRATGLNLGFDGVVAHRANGARPVSYVGLRLSFIRHP